MVSAWEVILKVVDEDKKREALMLSKKGCNCAVQKRPEVCSEEDCVVVVQQFWPRGLRDAYSRNQYTIVTHSKISDPVGSVLFSALALALLHFSPFLNSIIFSLLKKNSINFFAFKVSRQVEDIAWLVGRSSNPCI